MKQLMLIVLLGFILAGCAANQARPDYNRPNPYRTWNCHEPDAVGWVLGRPACSL
jgi:hypothetical protein